MVMHIRRVATVAAGLIAAALVLTLACARDGDAQGTTRGARVVPDDTAALGRLLRVVRGTDPLLCELATRTVDMHGSWSHWGPSQGNPLSIDSASAALLDWI